MMEAEAEMTGCGRKIGPYEVICAEFIAWAKAYDGPKFHAVLTDPPYGLEFMGKEWDAPHRRTFTSRARSETVVPQAGPEKYEAGLGYQDWTRAWASALIPLLHPGALVFCFGGTRTWHRLACGFEDAGFQIWDTLMWLHGQGFPKAQDISKLVDKANGDEREVVGTIKRGDLNMGVGYLADPANRNNTRCFGYGDEPITLPSKTSSPWSGHKTAALKPAWEPVLCFKAPTQGKTYAELAMEFGSGALNVDGGRIATVGEEIHTPQSDPRKRSGTVGMDLGISGSTEAKFQESQRLSVEKANRLGRYPPNLALECTCEEVEVVDAPVCGDISGQEPTSTAPRRGTDYGQFAKREAFQAYRGKALRHTDPNCPAAMLDAQAGKTSVTGNRSPQSRAASVVGTNWYVDNHESQEYPNEHGGPSRFFYCAKASRSEREAGLNSDRSGVSVKMATNQHPKVCQDCQRRFAHTFDSCPRCGSENWQYKAMLESGHKGKGIANDHPTVKPLALCCWLATLLLPPESVKPRRLLVPFSGSGSEMIAALRAGWDEVVGVEQDDHYCEIARARLEHWLVEAQPKLFEPKVEQTEIFKR